MRIWNVFVFLLLTSTAFSQVTKQGSSVDIYEGLQKLGNTGTAMFIAAHPDDENTRLISWLANSRKVNTIYLSMTRGDGGQNLIGTEKGPLLGLLRTQELLQARSVDGGKQWFTRANDFGYSKTATETREIWEEEKVLSDVVWAIRKHRPDVLINRFDHTSNGRTHGHHTTSAILGLEAFKLAGDPTAFPEQLEFVEVWQPKRIFFNTSWWFYGSQEAFEEVDKSDFIQLDVGEYYPLKGRSNNEIASLSRSKHACQGFGSASARGSQQEWVQLLDGDGSPNMTDLFQDIDLTWARTAKAGKHVQKAIEEALENYDFANPQASLNGILKIRNLILAQPESELRTRKLAEADQLLKWAAGLYIEATTNSPTGVAGEDLTVNIEVSNRSPETITLFGMGFSPAISMNKMIEELGPNQRYTSRPDITLPTSLNLSTPYWLEEAQTSIGMYTVEDQEQRGRPEAAPQLTAQFRVRIGNQEIQLSEPVQYKYVDPAIGEIYQPFHIVPKVAVNIAAPVYLFANGKSGTVEVTVTSFVENAEGTVNINAGEDWTFSEDVAFNIPQIGGTQTVVFQVQPPAEQVVSTLKASAEIGGETFAKSYTKVAYDHIPDQVVFQPAEAVIEKIDMIVPNVRVAYIQGSGDEVPQSLRQLGIEVTELPESDWRKTVFNSYDAVVIGIRAFNTLQGLKYATSHLWQYAHDGGVVIVQYNTSRRTVTDIAPYQLTLGRDRISQEGAELKFLAPQHPVLNHPNKITQDDFEDWVQERGLYFGSEWGPEFTPILEGHDVGESPKQGALLVAPVGEGHYVYTGLSFFRELPAGVPGAYRLFANLLALGQE